MAYNDFKRYVWLIDLLNNSEGASFKEIDDAWQDAKDWNPEELPLPRKTFYNHIKAIRNIFDIEIALSREDGKYHLTDSEPAGAGRMQKSLMSMLSLNSTVDRYKNLSGRILYEEEPRVYPEWMRMILYAMNQNRIVKLKYKSYGKYKPEMKMLAPYCLKMFKRRWYLLAKEGNALKTFALDDRTAGVEVTDSRFALPEDFDAGAYFKNVFGIRTSPPKRVLLKAYGHEADYLRSTPLHPSQKEEERGDGYSIFSLFVGIDAWEFYQEILSRGNRLEVLEPKTLRKDIADRIEEMRERYAEFWR